MLDELLHLKQNQLLKIERKTYLVQGMIKFTEGSSFWLEYILKSTKDDSLYYLDIEPTGKAAFHQMVLEQLMPDLSIKYGGKWYELFQKGKAKVDYCYGYTDVYQWEMVSYYEYMNVRNKKELFTIEKWHDMIECSIGKYISMKKIVIQ